MAHLALFESHSVSLAFSIALRSLILLSIILGATLLLRRAAAATRHMVLILGLVALLALPMLSWMLPDWNLEILPAAAVATATTGPVPAATMRSGSTADAPVVVTRTGRMSRTPLSGRSLIARKSNFSLT